MCCSSVRGSLAGINFRLQHSSCKIPGSDVFRPRYRRIYPPHADIRGYTFVSNRSRESCSTTKLSGSKKRCLSRLPSRRMDMRNFCGVVVASLFARGTLTVISNLPSPVLVDLIAIGAAFYVPLGTRRGYIQGAYGFRVLATNLILEGLVRLGGSLLMMILGFGVRGVIAANAAAIAGAYLAAAPKLAPAVPSHLRFSQALRESLQAMVFFAGQVIINNCDIVLVKHFFTPTMAGLYAAVAMVGRVIFAFSSAVVNTMFPWVALALKMRERKDLPEVIATSLLPVLGIGCTIALGLRLAPAVVWTTFFGSGFGIAGKYDLPYLLSVSSAVTDHRWYTSAW